ncbi:hypothetical protein EKH55_0314 [Sinorhizobium alkalisoli]|nr:hypothetical protein EKH55_0314 [Sinorhizobium alkalisoli]
MRIVTRSPGLSGLVSCIAARNATKKSLPKEAQQREEI